LDYALELLFFFNVGKIEKMLNLNDFFIRHFLKDIFPMLEKRSDYILLDLGCGSQPYKYIYGEYVTSYISADYNQRTPDLDILMDCQNLPFKDESFNVVLFSEVIEHIPKDYKAICEISRILKPGGHLIITWPFIYQLHEIPEDYNRLTEFGMSYYLKKNELELIKLKRRGNMFAVIHILIATLLTGFGEALRRMPLFGKVFCYLSNVLDKCIEVSMLIHFSLSKNMLALNPEIPGEKLKGIRGSFALWTLGYCALVRKK
jgi:SAM-dependent methyltransferase